MSRRFRSVCVWSSCVAILLLEGCGAAREAPATSAASSESITNNQEAGVDEGGIVKAWGDYLVVLRRGRLFTVCLGDQDMQPVSMVDAFPPGGSTGTWYDEMLIHDHTVVVIGYSYEAGATEIGLFNLLDDGTIRYQDTFYLRSNDYYSGRNYASRLVHGRLVFYMPHSIRRFSIRNGEVRVRSRLPSLRRYDGHVRGVGWNELLETSDISVPTGPVGSPTLHTVVS